MLRLPQRLGRLTWLIAVRACLLAVDMLIVMASVDTLVLFCLHRQITRTEKTRRLWKSGEYLDVNAGFELLRLGFDCLCLKVGFVVVEIWLLIQGHFYQTGIEFFHEHSRYVP